MITVDRGSPSMIFRFYRNKNFPFTTKESAKRSRMRRFHLFNKSQSVYLGRFFSDSESVLMDKEIQLCLEESAAYKYLPISTWARNVRKWDTQILLMFFLRTARTWNVRHPPFFTALFPNSTIHWFWLPVSHSWPMDIFPFHWNGTSQSHETIKSVAWGIPL